MRRPPRPAPLPYTTLFRSALLLAVRALAHAEGATAGLLHAWSRLAPDLAARSEATARNTAPKAWRFVGEMEEIAATFDADRKSTRLNSSHLVISYAVFCLN